MQGQGQLQQQQQQQLAFGIVKTPDYELLKTN